MLFAEKATEDDMAEGNVILLFSLLLIITAAV